MIWRLLPAGANPKDKKVVPVFENFKHVTLEAGKPFIGRLVLARRLESSTYSSARSTDGEKGSKAPISVLKQAIEVPALTGGEFMVSGLYVFRARKYKTRRSRTSWNIRTGTREEESIPLVNPTLAKTEPLAHQRHGVQRDRPCRRRIHGVQGRRGRALQEGGQPPKSTRLARAFRTVCR